MRTQIWAFLARCFFVLFFFFTRGIDIKMKNLFLFSCTKWVRESKIPKAAFGIFPERVWLKQNWGSFFCCNLILYNEAILWNVGHVVRSNLIRFKTILEQFFLYLKKINKKNLLLNKKCENNFHFKLLNTNERCITSFYNRQ